MFNKNKKEDKFPTLPPPFKCPHCGGTKGTWFDRSFSVDSDGNEIEPMCDRCEECGKRVG